MALRNRFSSYGWFGLGVAGIATFALVQAQGAGQPKAAAPKSDPDTGILHLETKIGSFKMLNGTGRVEVSFTGTMLISQVKGTVATSGSLIKEYPPAGMVDKEKQAWHGTGTIVVDGSFRAIQWFGTDMTATWNGRGRARVFGDFDKSLETGSYWYEDDPNKKTPWGTYGLEIALPEFKIGGAGTPVERKTGKSGG